MRDPRENLYIFAPFNNIGWSDYQGWHIQSVGCSCCSSTQENVTLEKIINMREELFKNIEKVDIIIKVMQAEIEFPLSLTRTASLIPPDKG